jgi:hypothetical protein
MATVITDLATFVDGFIPGRAIAARRVACGVRRDVEMLPGRFRGSVPSGASDVEAPNACTEAACSTR